MNQPKEAGLTKLIELTPSLNKVYLAYMDALPSIDLAPWEFESGIDQLEGNMDTACVIPYTQARASAVSAVLADIAGAIQVEAHAVDGLIKHMSRLMKSFKSFDLVYFCSKLGILYFV